MSFCRHCAKEIHETALACPQCGGLQSSEARPSTPRTDHWIAIVSLVTGIIAILAMLDDSVWGWDEVIGVLSVGILPSIALGILAIQRKSAGVGMAIAGLVMGVVALLALIGSYA